MDRLTERTKFGICGNNEGVKNYPLYKVAAFDELDHGIVGQCFEKLAEYEDGEEQGLLLRLPCKVGEKVYHPVFKYYKGDKLINEPYVIEAVVTSFGFKAGELTIIAKNGIELREFLADLIGKAIFLTREEAEQALKQMGEENGN